MLTSFRLFQTIAALLLAAITPQLATAGTPASGTVTSTTLLSSYIKMQETLAADQTDGLNQSARDLIASAKKLAKSSPADKKLYNEIASAAEPLLKPKSLDEMRKEFKTLSTLLVNLAKKTKAPGIRLMHCPMFPGDWVQNQGDTKNPYYGKSMLGCGEELQK